MLDPLLDLVKPKDKMKGEKIGYSTQESQRGVSLEHTLRLQLIERTDCLKYEKYGRFSENRKRPFSLYLHLITMTFYSTDL